MNVNEFTIQKNSAVDNFSTHFLSARFPDRHCEQYAAPVQQRAPIDDLGRSGSSFFHGPPLNYPRQCNFANPEPKFFVPGSKDTAFIEISPEPVNFEPRVSEYPNFRPVNSDLQHLGTKTDLNNYSCRNSEDKTTGNLKNSDKIFKCDFCDFSSLAKRSLYDHLSFHKEEEPFKCTLCNYSTLYKPNISDHMKIHKLNNSFKCGYCNFSAFYRHSIVIHSKIHEHESQEKKKELLKEKESQGVIKNTDSLIKYKKRRPRNKKKRNRSKNSLKIKLRREDYRNYEPIIEIKTSENSEFETQNENQLNSPLKEFQNRNSESDSETLQPEIKDTFKNSELKNETKNKVCILENEITNTPDVNNSLNTVESRGSRDNLGTNETEESQPFHKNILNYEQNYTSFVGVENKNYLETNAKNSDKFDKRNAFDYECEFDEKLQNTDKLVEKIDQSDKDIEQKPESAQKKKSFKCKLCSYSAARKYHLERHTNLHIGLRPHKCDLCPFTATEKYRVRTHRKCHSVQKGLFKCEFCEFSTDIMNRLKKHLQTHSKKSQHTDNDTMNSGVVRASSLQEDKNIGTYSYTKGEKPDNPDSFSSALESSPTSSTLEKNCTLSEFKTSNTISDPSELLKTRAKNSDLKKLFKCNRCNFSTAEKWAITQHSKEHNKDKAIKCFPSSDFPKYEFIKQVSTETGEILFKCDLCTYTTSRKHHALRHLSTHTAEKPFNCPLCDFTAAHKSAVVRHNRTHTGEKPFKCDLCNYSANQNSSVKRHINTRHS